MAGAGFKTFNTGDVLTASDVNTYLMQQTVMVFASSAARTSALGANVAEGMLSYLKDTDQVEVYNGTSWVASDDPNAIQNTIVDAKGDIITATAADTPARLAVGADGYTLIADSSTSTGLAYSPTLFAGKNKIINGDFGIWQRGTSFTTLSSVYWADRWVVDAGISAGNRTISQQTFTPGTAPVAGYEGAYFARYAVSNATISSQNIQQRIEDVRTLAGQTVTLSFWAKADASRTITPYYQQNFGSGGSGAVSASVGTANLTTSWQRFTFTFSMPSISGKTIGTSSFLTIFLDLPTTATATYDFWGFQLEAGSTATNFQTATGTIQGELAAAQRYYEILTRQDWTAMGQATSTTAAAVPFMFKVTKRSAPTMTVATAGKTAGTIAFLNSSGGYPTTTGTSAAYSATVDGFYLEINGNSASYTAGNASVLYSTNSTTVWTASAEL